jgi:enoyl-CoA hydratase
VNTDFVKARTQGAIGILTLDRPNALNALDQPMCLAIDTALTAWATDDAVAAVVIHGSTERAFCAGGDVRMVREDGLAWKQGESDGRLGREFFRDEYRMNRRIQTFPKPYIALIDGVTMGGGVGLSIHGSHRVATERTLLAMPETNIGLFPDVGASYALSRLPGEIGTYLGLTGARLRAGDLLELGIATHIVGGNRMVACREDLLATVGHINTLDSIEQVLRHYRSPPSPMDVMPRQPLIDRCFGHDRVEDIMAALDANSDPFATHAAAALRTMSPTSLKLTLKELRKGRSMTFDECMVMEYRLSQSILAGGDFYEGVRAQLVDKDRDPRWYPTTLDAVDDSAIDSLFLPPLHGDLTFPT